MTSKLPISTEGLARLHEAIENQKRLVRELGTEVGEAAGGAACDWHDNAPFEQARRELELASRRLLELCNRSSSVIVAKPEDQDQVVAFGTTVRIDVAGSEQVWVIVGSGEGTGRNGTLSIDAPLAAALVGLHEGDIAEVRLSDKPTVIEVLEIFGPSYRYNTLKRA